MAMIYFGSSGRFGSSVDSGWAYLAQLRIFAVEHHGIGPPCGHRAHGLHVHKHGPCAVHDTWLGILLRGAGVQEECAYDDYAKFYLHGSDDIVVVLLRLFNELRQLLGALW